MRSVSLIVLEPGDCLPCEVFGGGGIGAACSIARRIEHGLVGGMKWLRFRESKRVEVGGKRLRYVEAVDIEVAGVQDPLGC